MGVGSWGRSAAQDRIGEPRAKAEPNRSEVAIDENAFAGRHTAELVRGEEPAERHCRGSRPPSVSLVQRVALLPYRFFAGQAGEQVEGRQVGDAGKQELRPMVVDDGPGPFVSVTVRQLAEVLADRH